MWRFRAEHQSKRDRALKAALDEKRWDKPVRVTIDGPGRIRVVQSTREAAECLLYRWPDVGGPEHRAAREACIAVLKDQQPPEYARQAFVAAAKEADILIENKLFTLLARSWFGHLVFRREHNDDDGQQGSEKHTYGNQ